MMRAHVRLVFALGERLQRTAGEVERLSVREVNGWLAHFRRQQLAREQAAAGDGALELRGLDRATLRTMFHH